MFRKLILKVNYPKNKIFVLYIMADLEGKSFSDFGLLPKPDEFYASIDALINEMDDMDLVRCMKYMASLICKTPRSYPPLVIITLMQELQNCELACAKLKEILGGIVLTGVVCKKCGKELPHMTILQHLEGVNKECPHTLVDIDNSALIEQHKKCLEEHKQD